MKFLLSFSLSAQKFEEAAQAIKVLSKRPTDQEFLELYALFKQATVGDVNTGEFYLSPELMTGQVV